MRARSTLLFLGLLATGCGPDRDSVLRETLTMFDQVADALSRVVDDETAMEAQETFKQLLPRIKKCNQELAQLVAAGDMEIPKRFMELSMQMGNPMMRMAQEMKRIEAQPKLAASLKSALQQLNAAGPSR